MIKLLIADDEPRIRRGLANALDWEELDIVIVDFAANGLEALSKAQEHTPDICLVDIRMPRLNGLEFIEQMRARTSETLFIVVTGHDEFVYAKQAITLGVFDYILKPIDNDALMNTIERAVHYIRQERLKKQHQELVQALVRNNRPVLLGQLINDIVQGKLNGEQAQEMMELHGLRLNDKISLLMIHYSKEHRINMKAANKLSDTKLIEKVCADMFQMYNSVAYGFDSYDNIIILAQTDTFQNMEELESKLQQQIKQVIGSGVVMLQIDMDSIEQAAEYYSRWLESIETVRSPIIEQARRYIAKRYSDSELSLQELADHLKISQGYLSRLFKQEVGITFGDYVSQIRISEAVRLLSDPQLKINSIAESVGYKSQHYFSAAFKRELGTSPIQYRQGKRGERDDDK